MLDDDHELVCYLSDDKVWLSFNEFFFFQFVVTELLPYQIIKLVLFIFQKIQSFFKHWKCL